jgi:hypothetical protein
VATFVRVCCEECHQEPDMMPADLVLHVVPDALDLVGDESCYEFVCPKCLRPNRKRMDCKIALLLLEGGVTTDSDPNCLLEP